MTLGYFAGFECSGGQATPGKSAMGLIVVDMSGNRINFGKGVARYLGRIVSGLILGFGFLMIGFDKQKRGLHDYIAGTYVIKKGFYMQPAPVQYNPNAGYRPQSSEAPPDRQPVVQPVRAQSHQATTSLFINGNVIPLTPGTVIADSQIPGSRSQLSSGVVAEVQSNAQDTSVLGLKNHSQGNWTIFNNGTATILEPGKTVRVDPGTRIKFGMLTGEIRK